MRHFALLLLTLPLSAFAGSSSRDCYSSGKAIEMGAGNSTNTVKIKFVDKDGTKGVHEAPVKLMPEFDYNTEINDQTITAIPVSGEKFLSKKHEHMHVKHADGTECDGRQAWDDQSVQTYVLTGKDAASFSSLFYEKKVRNLTKDGYIVAQFRCHTYGITTAGGCFVEDDHDEVTWVKDEE